MANAVYLVVWEAHTIRHGSSSSVDKVFVGEERKPSVRLPSTRTRYDGRQTC